MSEYIYYRLKLFLNTAGVFQSIDIIFSPPTTPGEGEHKIMDYISDHYNLTRYKLLDIACLGQMPIY